MKTVYLFGSLPPKSQQPFGGGEIGNLRTVKMLESYGYRVVAIRQKRSKISASNISKRLSYPYRLLGTTLKFFFTLLFGSRKSVVHIVGFGGPTIYREMMFVGIAKFLGYKAIYELRGGRVISSYDKGGERFRKIFAWNLNHADMIFTQGIENEPLLKSISQVPIYHYPNCVSDDFAPVDLPEKRSDTINLLFFGRLEADKNVILVIEAAAILQSRYDNIKLTVIGSGKPEYVELIKETLRNKLKLNSFTYIPGCTHDELKDYLKDKHFYLFPSAQECEGQSNAVTEAMSYGIIPIASPQGFSRSLVGNDIMIVKEMKAEAYADMVTEIISNNMVEKLRHFVYQRVKNNYTETIVTDNMKSVYHRLFSE